MNDLKKKLRYQSWYRRCKETDGVLGYFADRYLPDASEADTTLFKALLDEDDWDIWRWITQEQPNPPEYDTLLTQIRAFQKEKHVPA